MTRARTLPHRWSYFTLHVALPLFLGGTIYTLFRSRTLVMFQWWEQLHMMRGITWLRTAVSDWTEHIPSWLLYSFPDGTWLYAYVAFYRLVWAGASRAWMMTWIGLGLLMSIGFELGQGLGWMAGTFDRLDLLFYGLSIALAFRATLPAASPARAATDPRDR